MGLFLYILVCIVGISAIFYSIKSIGIPNPFIKPPKSEKYYENLNMIINYLKDFNSIYSAWIEGTGIQKFDLLDTFSSKSSIIYFKKILPKKVFFDLISIIKLIYDFNNNKLSLESETKNQQINLSIINDIISNCEELIDLASK